MRKLLKTTHTDAKNVASKQIQKVATSTSDLKKINFIPNKYYEISTIYECVKKVYDFTL